MKPNSAKDCNGCMGAAFGDCAECTGKKPTISKEYVSKLADSCSDTIRFKVDKVKSHIQNNGLVFNYTISSDKNNSCVEFTKQEINTLLEILNKNVKTHLNNKWSIKNISLDNMYEYLSELRNIVDISQKLKIVKEELDADE